ncbi:MAG: AraC family transcriptional regulator [Pseudomonadota bacterium]
MRDRFPLLEDAARAWAALQPVESAGAFSASWRMWELDRLIVSEASCSPVRFDRPVGRFSRYDNEFVLIQQYISSQSDLSVGDHRHRATEGQIVLIDKSRPFASVGYGAKTRGVVVPHELIGYDPSKHPPMVVLRPGAPGTRILGRVLESLPARLEAMIPSETERLSEELSEVARAFFLERDQKVHRGAVRRARRIAIENFIEQRIRSSKLGVSELCRHFGVSRSDLYRHFPDRGGITGLIQDRRLNAAFKELRSLGKRRGAVSEVSERWGFYDTAHFNRAFRKWSGVSPTQALDLPMRPEYETLAPGMLLEGLTASASRSEVP